LARIIKFNQNMPMELQIIRAREFIRLGPHGRFDLKASKAALADLARACCKRGIQQALVDLRALHPGPKPIFSPNDLVMLVNTFREVGFTRDERLAVLYGSDPHHRARLFAFIAKLRGWSVQAFDNYEEAVLWLSHSEDAQEETEFTPKPKAVPVRTPKPVKASSGVKTATQPVIHFKTGRRTTRRNSGNPQMASPQLARGNLAVLTFLLLALAGSALLAQAGATAEMLNFPG
jgi:hypothetical protein